jgi:hypothetical protein
MPCRESRSGGRGVKSSSQDNDCGSWDSDARNAFSGWKAVPFERRKAILASLLNKIEDHADELSALLTAELGCRGLQPLVFGHFRCRINVEPEVETWIAAQRLNRLAQVL